MNRFKAGRILALTLLAAFAVFHSVGLVPALLVLFALPGALSVTPCLGISYPIATAKTKASALVDTPLSEEQLWAKTLFLNEDMQYEDNPFVDNMVGGRDSGKAILEVVETKKVHGTEVNVPLISGLDGEGTFGDDIRSGNDMTYDFGNFKVKVGRTFFSTAWTVTAESETMQGGVLMSRVNRDLSKVLARRRSGDMLMNLRKAAYTPIGAPNLVLPLGRGSVDDIVSTDTLNTTMVSAVGEILPGLGASPMNVTKDKASDSEKLIYMGLVNNIAISSFVNDPRYTNAKTNADERGRLNASFTGELLPWDGVALYRWNNKDQKKGPIGNPLMPRAKLGVAITGAASGTVLQGGGFTYNAVRQASQNPSLYFKYFPAAAYKCFNGDLFVATTDQTYAVAIVNPNGTFGVFQYQVTDGKTLTLSSNAQAVGPAGKRTTNFVQGATIYFCNNIGTYLAWSLFYGQHMLGSGVGSLNGADSEAANLQMGSLKKGEEDRGSRKWVGTEAVWGCRVVNDWSGQYPNFLLLQHAITPANAPVLS